LTLKNTILATAYSMLAIRLKLCQDELRDSKESGSQNTTYKQGYVKIVVIPKHPIEQQKHR